MARGMHYPDRWEPLFRPYMTLEGVFRYLVQHARAKNVKVSLRCARKDATLTIEDDGAGFDVRRAPDERHGLRGMRERARLAGGTLRVVSQRGKGTRVIAKVGR